MLLHLGLDPAAKERLVADPSLVPSAIEETLRLDPPVPNFARTLTRDVELHGRTLQAGDRVLLVYGAANRDEAEFPDPDALVVDRHPNRHLSFGAGVHRCLGAHLARLELRIVLEEVLAAIPDYRIEDAAAVSIKGGINRTVSRLPAVWTTA
jgi:cytochrome P450